MKDKYSGQMSGNPCATLFLQDEVPCQNRKPVPEAMECVGCRAGKILAGFSDHCAVENVFT